MPIQLVANGDVPDANYFNNLSRQSVIVCTSGTRPSSPNEGMVIFETDTERFMAYNGSSWRAILQLGSIAVTPVLTASTANPVLGTGATRNGQYVLHNGDLCTYWGQVAFGTSGVSAGTGQYFVSLPFQASPSSIGPTVGSAMLRQTSGALLHSAVSYLFASASTLSLAFNGSAVGAGTPWTWAASDYFAWNITYRTV